jgi:hypothetical protein
VTPSPAHSRALSNLKSEPDSESGGPAIPCIFNECYMHVAIIGFGTGLSRWNSFQISESPTISHLRAPGGRGPGRVTSRLRSSSLPGMTRLGWPGPRQDHVSSLRPIITCLQLMRPTVSSSSGSCWYALSAGRRHGLPRPAPGRGPGNEWLFFYLIVEPISFGSSSLKAGRHR